MTFNKNLLILLFVFLIADLSQAQSYQRRGGSSDFTFPVGVTHLLPSPHVIPAGQLILGTTTGYGFFDIFDVTTNLYLDLQQVFNISTKLSVWQDSDYAMAVFASYVSQSVKVQQYNATTGLIDNSTKTMTALAPGAVFSYRILSRLTGNVGATFNIQNPEIKKSEVREKTAYLQGLGVNKEFAYGFTRTLSLAVGGSYDLTYDIPGAGASIHLGGFQAGLHYYFNVKEGSVLPIIGGSYSAQL